MNMLHSLRIATLAAVMLLAAVAARPAQTATVDDTAKFLAGMMPSADSPLTPLTKDPAWQRHAKFFDSAFAQLEQRQLSRIRAWSDTNLAAPRPTMFYMFSGPDFLYANAFYSKASTYVLSALEPVGSVPDLSRLPRGGIASALYNVERSLGSILSFSFFITKQMKTDLQAGQISGTLPILYVFLARSGMTMKSVSPIALDDQGAAYFAGENAGPNAVRGVRIIFAGSDGQEKTLYYFSTDLSNSGVKASGFLKFCATLAPGNSLIKSASYLLHSGNFTTVRDFLLANSATIIQDDSGIPLAYYSAKKWRFFPFGRYLGPIDEFPGRYQESYAALFRRAQPIDFGIGYRWRTHESNLLLSVRLPDDGSPPSTPHHRPRRHQRHHAPRKPGRRRISGRGRVAASSGRWRSARVRTAGLHQRTLWLGTMKAACAWRFGVRAEIMPRRDDDDEQREDREQVVLPAIVTVVADFPAHRLFPPLRSTKSMRTGDRSSAAHQQCALHQRVDAAPAPVAPRQIPSRTRRPRQRHVVDAGCAPGLAAQDPRQRHPSAAPQAEAFDRFVAIDRACRQMPAVVADQRRQRVPVDPDQRASRVARQTARGAGTIRA